MHLGRGLAWMLPLLLCGLAGCFGGGAPAASGNATSASTSSTSSMDVPAPRIEPPVPLVLYFTASGGLSLEMPSPGAVSIGTPATQFATGLQPKRFATDALRNATLVGPEDLHVVAYVSSAAPQPSNGGFDLGLWFGSEQALALGSINVGAQLHPSGTPQMFEFDLAFGTRKPILAPAGDSLVALMAGQFGGETGEPHLLVGGETASRLELTVRNYTVDPLAGVQELPSEGFAGTVTNPSFVPDCGAIPGSVADHAFTVAATAQQLRVHVQATGTHAPSADLDLFLLDGTLVLADGLTPFATEAVFLADDTLFGQQGKTLTARIVACGPGPIEYDLNVEQAQLPPRSAP